MRIVRYSCLIVIALVAGCSADFTLTVHLVDDDNASDAFRVNGTAVNLNRNGYGFVEFGYPSWEVALNEEMTIDSLIDGQETQRIEYVPGSYCKQCDDRQPHSEDIYIVFENNSLIFAAGECAYVEPKQLCLD